MATRSKAGTPGRGRVRRHGTALRGRARAARGAGAQARERRARSRAGARHVRGRRRAGEALLRPARGRGAAHPQARGERATDRSSARSSSGTTNERRRASSTVSSTRASRASTRILDEILPRASEPPEVAARGHALRGLLGRQAAATRAGLRGGARVSASRSHARCRSPRRSSSSTPTRSCTTTCPRWTTTSCAAAGRRCTSSTARRTRSWSATRCSPRPSRRSRAAMCPSAVFARLAEAAGSRALVGGQVDDLAFRPELATAELVRSIHERKTAALFRFSAWAPGAVGRPPAPPISSASTASAWPTAGPSSSSTTCSTTTPRSARSCASATRPRRARAWRPRSRPRSRPRDAFGPAGVYLRGLASAVERAVNVGAA